MTEYGQVNVILALSLLLAVGFFAARVAQLLRLPSVTGYIVAGIGLGPVGLDLVSQELLGSRLEIFTTIALMLVAFAIGERFDLEQLRPSARTLTRVSLGESLGTFLLVGLGVGLVAWAGHAGGPNAGPALWIAVALVCASIAVATAPASTIAVIRELRASGPLSRLVLSSMVVNNALSITLFGFSVAAAKVLLGTAAGSGIAQALQPLVATAAALALGFATGFATDLIVHKLSRQADVLIVALTAVFFCGGLASYLGLSPLLAGVAAGFAVVNRDRRDVRAFRALNDFEPPIYGIFFALAGAQMHLREVVAAGAIGTAFVVCRALGKYLGAWLGARSVGMPPQLARSVGLGLLPQAGLAIGLAYLVRQEDALEAIRAMVIDVVVASVVVNELLGPPLVRLMALRAGEVPADSEAAPTVPPTELDTVEVVPWTWPKLQPARHPDGFVVAGLGHPSTAAGVVRIATLLSHHYNALPLGVHVVTQPAPDDFWHTPSDPETTRLFRLARQEVRSLGYEVHTEVEFAEEISEGILRIVETYNAQAVVLGHPIARQALLFGRIVDAVARDALCPVVVVRFVGALHTERILVPFSSLEELTPVHPLVCALATVEEHRITLLRLMPPETAEHELREAEEELAGWPTCLRIRGQVAYRAVATDSRVHEILDAAEDHDIIVMATSTHTGLRKLFFGSLAEDVAQRSPRPMLLVHGGMESRPLAELT